MPIRTGLDITEVDRVRELMQSYGNHFRDRFFRPPERKYAESKADEAEHLAGIWAAKEATFKVLGHGYRWRSVVVHHRPSGRPYIELRDPADRDHTPIPAGADWDVTITHDAGLALASAVCVWFDSPLYPSEGITS